MKLPQQISTKIHELLDGPASSDYNHRQVQLVVEKFVVEHPEANLDDAKLEEIMMEWAGSSLSSGFRGIARNPEFAAHSRFNGDVARITTDEVLYFVEHGKMPE